ncbi:MAG: DUF6089 family protein [Panacibacter sp.]
MKKILLRLTLYIMVMSITTRIQAQRLYIHIEGGAVNYGGDLQDKVFTLNQANSLLGGGIHYKVSNIFSLEASFSAGKLSASDAKSNADSYRRNLSFYTNITEGSVMVQASLKDVLGNAKFTPYVTGGVAVFHFNPYAYTFKGQKVLLQPLGTEAIQFNTAWSAFWSWY